MREAFQDIGNSGCLSIKIWDLAKQEGSFSILNQAQTVEKIADLYGTPILAEASAAKGELSLFVKADAEGRQVGAGEIDCLNAVLNIAVEKGVKSIDETKKDSSPAFDSLKQPANERCFNASPVLERGALKAKAHSGRRKRE